METMAQLLGGLSGEKPRRQMRGYRHCSHAFGRPRYEVCRPNGSGSILGVVVRRTSHDRRAGPTGCWTNSAVARIWWVPR